MPYNHAKFQINILNLLYILSGHCQISMPKYIYTEHSKLSSSMVWCNACFICWFCNQISHGQWWNQNGGSRWHCWIRESTHIIFEWTKTLHAEAEQYIYVFSSSAGDIDRIEMLYERFSEAGETVFILRERRGERASELISSDRDLEKANFQRNMDELSTHLTRLRVYFENMARCIFLGSE